MFGGYLLKDACVFSLDEAPATGTGTLVIQLEDVNDNAPVIEERSIQVCLLYQNDEFSCVHCSPPYLWC